MIRIMHICSDSNIGGAVITLLRLLTESDKSSFCHCVVLPRTSPLLADFRALGIKVYTSAAQDRSTSFLGFVECVGYIRDFSPDIVHTHGALYGRIAARMCGVRSLVYTRHTYCEKVPPMPIALVNRFVTTGAVAVSRALIPQIRKSGICENIFLIENGCQLIESSSDTISDTYTLLYLGRIVKGKGLVCAIDAVELLKSNSASVSLLIVGDGEYKDELARYVRKKKLDSFVSFLPHQKDIRPVISRCDIAINCSVRNEATSNFIIESLSAGKPVVLSSVGGNIYIADSGVDGEYFDSGNAASLACAIRKIISNRDVYAKYACNARDKYRMRFTAHRMVRKYERLWRDEYEKHCTRKG